MSESLFIPVILGTGREGRRSEHVAHFVHELVTKQENVTTELIDVRDYAQPTTVVDWMEDASSTEPWVAKATEADGFIIVSPEYNHFFPGELKILLDQTLAPYHRKPAGLAMTANGNWGGTRAGEHLRAYVVRLGMVATHPSAHFPSLAENFAEDGTPKDPETMAEHTQPMIDEVVWYAQALKGPREAANNA